MNSISFGKVLHCCSTIHKSIKRKLICQTINLSNRSPTLFKLQPSKSEFTHTPYITPRQSRSLNPNLTHLITEASALDNIDYFMNPWPNSICQYRIYRGIVTRRSFYYVIRSSELLTLSTGEDYTVLKFLRKWTPKGNSVFLLIL